MPERLLTSEKDMAEGLAWLAGSCPNLARAVQAAGEVPMRQREAGFGAVLQMIVSQQVSVASARAIWSRLEEAGLVQADKVVDCTDEDMRACGMSRQKMRYARALADSGIDFVALGDLPTDQVIAQLTKVTGIGVWTAEIYAMFSLRRADVFPSGDLALQEAARLIFDMDSRPTDKALRKQAEAWSPWRTVAAKLFWKYYHIAKQREGIGVGT